MGTTSGRSPPTGKLKRETRNVPGLGSENLGPPAKERDQRGGQRARLGQKGRQGGGKGRTIHKTPRDRRAAGGGN